MWARIVSLNVGRATPLRHARGEVPSAIRKTAAEGSLTLGTLGLDGDEQADLRVHGGPDKALCVYPREHAVWWAETLGRSFGYGEFGENLDTEGIDVTNAIVGERWEIGSTVLEVSEPRVPCWRLAFKMKDQGFPRQFVVAGRPGTYLRIAVEGEIGSGDEIRVVERPAHGLSIGDVFRIYMHDRHEAERLLTAPQLSPGWRAWAQRSLGR